LQRTAAGAACAVKAKQAIALYLDIGSIKNTGYVYLKDVFPSTIIGAYLPAWLQFF
jgi:hypothetical protein